MGRRRYSTGVFRVSVEEGETPFKQITAKRKYSDIHYLVLTIYKVSIRAEGESNFPTIVHLEENNGGYSRFDRYSFDEAGELMGHSFSVFRITHADVHERPGKRSDMSTERLRSYGKDIEEMLSTASLPTELAEDLTVKHLVTNSFAK